MLARQLCNSLDGIFRLYALSQTSTTDRPRIFGTDQDAQFTADVFTACLPAANLLVSVDGRGLDNVFCKRLVRSDRCGNMYLNRFDTVP